MHTRSPFLSYHHCASVDDILSQIDPYITSFTERIDCSTLTGEEREEIAQRVRLKMWEILPAKKIDNLLSYLKTTVHHEFISFLRQRKLLAPLATSEEGDIYYGTVLINVSQGMNDPQMELEREEASRELLDQVVAALIELPPTQRSAMVCHICEHIDDPLIFAERCKLRNLDISAFQWPDDKTAKQRMQASCRPARSSMAQYMQLSLRTSQRRCIVKERTLQA